MLGGQGHEIPTHPAVHEHAPSRGGVQNHKPGTSSRPLGVHHISYNRFHPFWRRCLRHRKRRPTWRHNWHDTLRPYMRPRGATPHLGRHQGEI